MHIDVALVPGEAEAWPARVCVVVDELRASSTITGLLDAGCSHVIVTATLSEGGGWQGGAGVCSPASGTAAPHGGSTPTTRHSSSEPLACETVRWACAPPTGPPCSSACGGCPRC
ncbi:MAG TPA: hypothetical protein DCX12_07575 [Chloroflexi bacterium]|nr:hypothetical protein [Chloroflexota bacterium]